MASIRAASRVRRSRKAAVAPAALASAKSSTIGRKDRRRGAADRLGHGGERPVLLGGRRQRERTRGLARLAADVAHRGFELGFNLALAADRLERSVHGLDPSGIQRFLPCSGGCCEAAWAMSFTHSNPQAVMGPSEKRGNILTLPVFKFGNSQRVRRGCHASASRPPVQSAAQAFSRGGQICGRGPRRGRWAFARSFTLCGAAGRAADQCSVGSRPAAGTERPRAAA